MLPLSTLGGDLVPEGTVAALFGVLDGHGGFTCAEYCREKLPANLLAQLGQGKKARNIEEGLRGAFKRAFKLVDNNFLTGRNLCFTATLNTT